MPPTTPIKLYGASWCGDTRRSRRLLDDLSIPYEYLDIDRNPAAKQYVIAQAGKQKIPVIDLTTQILIVPSDDVFTQALRTTGHLT
jgi:mycoredoxin